MLVNLRELNVAQNRLSYLPAEMLEMKLDVLQVDHNPWRQRPPPDQDSSGTVESGGSGHLNAELRRPMGSAHSGDDDQAGQHLSGIRKGGLAVSRLATHFMVPSLTECCLRVLLTPYHSSTTHHDSASPMGQPRLLVSFALPLPNIERIPAPIVDTLRACVPQAVAKPDPQTQASPSKRARRSSARSRVSSVQSDIFGDFLEPSRPEDTEVDADVPEDDEEIPPGIGTCMSPLHPRHSRPVFVDHAVERFEWVHTIAGHPVHEDAGVPVRWRGCMPGCLDFLGEDVPRVADIREGVAERLDDRSLNKIEIAEPDGEMEVEAIDLGGGFGEDFD